jgi:hypothetical protein
MSIGASPSLKTIADIIGDIAPHSMSEMYGINFAGGSSSPASGTISLSSFRNKNFDTTAPVITLANGDEGTTNYTVERGTAYVDPGATADTGETVTVNTSQLNMAVSSTYIVTYSATDAAGNIGTANRIVIVEDTIAPVITLANGDEGTTNYTVERGTTYVDPGATADGGETVTVDTSQLNMAVSETYTVGYSATDADGNIGTASRTVIVEDTIAPVITLANGDEGTTNYTVERGTTYVDPGATTDTGEPVTVDTSELNMAVSETYTVTYSATDADGNIGTASRTVIVEDTTAPVITLIGDNPYTVTVGTYAYVDPGATSDGGETVTVDTSWNPGFNGGTWTVYYSATDAAGNTGTATRTVKTEIRQPYSGWANETNSRAYLSVGPCNNQFDQIRWERALIINLAPTITFPITVDGWTYYYESTPYDYLPALYACDVQGQLGNTTGATYHRIYRTGVPDWG